MTKLGDNADNHWVKTEHFNNSDVILIE